MNNRNESLLNPASGWVKTPEHLIVSTPFLKMPPTVRALAFAVHVAGSGHAASKDDPCLDATLLPALLGQDTEHIDATVEALVASGLWTRLDDERVDTGIGSQLHAREEFHQKKVRAGKAGAASRANSSRHGVEDKPFD